MWPPALVLVAMALQSQQAWGSPRRWVRSMEGLAEEPRCWCEMALVRTVTINSFGKGRAGLWLFFRASGKGGLG